MKTNKNIGLITLVVVVMAIVFSSCARTVPSDVHPQNVHGNAHY